MKNGPVSGLMGSRIGKVTERFTKYSTKARRDRNEVMQSTGNLKKEAMSSERSRNECYPLASLSDTNIALLHFTFPLSPHNFQTLNHPTLTAGLVYGFQHVDLTQTHQ